MALPIEVVKLLPGIEGGLSNRACDYGGLTNWGISQRAHPELDVRNMTFEDACLWYEKNYWIKNRLNEITDITLATQMFFLLINMSETRAIKIIQTAVKSCSIIEIQIDGIIGNATIAAINNSSKDWLRDKLRVEECKTYLAIVDADHTQLDNLRSWLRRALT